MSTVLHPGYRTRTPALERCTLPQKVLGQYSSAGRPTGLTDIGDGSREFSLEALVNRHRYYNLTRSEALDMAEHIVDTVRTHRADAADVAEMLTHEKQLLTTRTATQELVGSLRRIEGGGGTARGPQPRDRGGRFDEHPHSPPEVSL